LGAELTAIHIGVTDLPYARRGGVTTGDVAGWLEERYGLFSAFVAMHEKVIQHDIENSLKGAVETMIMRGAGPKRAPLATALTDIEDLFKDSISMQSYDFKIPGVPTLAALKGINHRMKHPYAKRNPRPSFRDTGTFQSSIRAWTD
jgi:hypothetical protein